MSGFWAGALSSLLGAVVGGIFSAWTTRFQVQSAFRVAQMHIEAAARDREEAIQSDLERWATTEITRTVSRMASEVQAISEDHYFAHVDNDTANQCPAPKELTRRINEWRRELNDVQFQYGQFLPEDLEPLFERLFEHLPFGDHEEKFWKSYRGKYHGYCLAGSWSEEFETTAREVVKEFNYYVGLTYREPFHLTLHRKPVPAQKMKTQNEGEPPV